MDSKSPLIESSSIETDPHALGNLTAVASARQKRRFRAWMALGVVVLLWFFSRDGLKHGGRGDDFRGRGKVEVEKPVLKLPFQDEFAQMKASEQLEWHPCQDQQDPRFFCAKLAVPMDYKRPLTASKEHPRVELALFMVASPKSLETGRFSVSPMLVNPGGPGGPAILSSLAPAVASLIHPLIPSLDIIGFDPRGIGYTMPTADCYSFPSNFSARPIEVTRADYVAGAFNRASFHAQAREVGIINSSEIALAKIDKRARMVGALCEKKDKLEGGEEGSILRNMSTTAVARDMLSIVDAWTEWRENKGIGAGVVTDADVGDEMADTKDKLVFWGFSYGTLLGSTFASMFPDRVGRMVLNGVVDADYYVSPMWTESLQDTDKVEASFFKFCHQAKNSCALYRENDTEADIKKRFRTTLEGMHNNPITGVSTRFNDPAQVTYSDIKALVFFSLYMPRGFFPLVAQVLDILDRGLYQQVLDLLFLPPILSQLYCDLDFFFPGSEAQPAVMCSDKRSPLNDSLPDHMSRYKSISNVSHYVDGFATVMFGCSHWPLQAMDPPMRWSPSDPLNPHHPAHPYPKHQINTSYPLLFVSNTADPVTPLAAGVKMAKKFKNAGLVEVLGEGHCSLNVQSECVLRVIGDYFKGGEGNVPPPPASEKGEGGKLRKWKQCERDSWPWKGYQPAGHMQGAVMDADKEQMTRSNRWKSAQRSLMHTQQFGENGLGMSQGMRSWLGFLAENTAKGEQLEVIMAGVLEREGKGATCGKRSK